MSSPTVKINPKQSIIDAFQSLEILHLKSTHLITGHDIIASIFGLSRLFPFYLHDNMLANKSGGSRAAQQRLLIGRGDPVTITVTRPTNYK